MSMKLRIRKGIAMVLAMAILLGLIPFYAREAQALTPTYSVSSAYKASRYYTALCGVTLTGNQRDDIINVALSQVGYTEGSYSGDYGGADDGSYSNYTEYNYWYNNYITSDMPVGGSYAPWCATFVSWCAEQANIPTSILQRSTAAGHSAWYFNVNFYAGGSTLNADRDNTDKFMGYNYTPKKGDLFFTRTWSHVGLVVGVSGSYVITVEGNTNDGGSAEGLGVFRRTSRRISDLYFGVPEYVEDYSSSCTYYPSHCQIKVNASTPINTQPCSVSTANNSSTLSTAPSGQTYTATGLYLNSYGNYWYRVQTSGGKTGYLYAGDVSYVKELTSDIALTGADAPSAHVAGGTFTVNGTIASKYNRLNTASCYIYPGFSESTDATTGYSASVGGTQYNLAGSDVDYNTSFGALTSGKYTYEIAATYVNYYATGATSRASNSGTVKLLTDYFVVIPASVSQSSCAHSYSTSMVGAASCLEGGTQVKACSICGLVTKTEITSGAHSFGSWTTVSATCTTDGKRTRTCSVCGNVETQVLSASGHSYTTQTTAATCTDYASYTFTCSVCGEQHTMNAAELAANWIDFLPGGMNASQFNSRTEYRYADLETKTSTATSLEGYTQTGSQWVQSGSGSVEYVPSWPSGFSTSSSLYTAYNKAAAKKTESETATTKTTVNSDDVVGYLYYHWCYADSYYSTAESSGSYTTFHAYYDTTDPDSFTCDTSDMSYRTSHATCSNSEWWFVTEVYAQNYTNYQKQFTYQGWTAFSGWSTTPVTESTTRKVQTRTVYQLNTTPTLASHNYVNGTCTVCGAADAGYVPPAPPVTTDYYLFGYINGSDYACEGDYENLGTYKFVNGKLTVTFDSDSYVAVKDGSNQKWYMTDGWQGTDSTSATLYLTGTLSNADKLFVPGGREVTFTLTVNADDTLTLSYTAEAAPVLTPTLTPKYPTLSYEDEVFINVYFSASDLGNLTTADMGLITWSSARPNGTVSDAEANIPGAVYNSATGLYQARTAGIPAKSLGDNIYFKLYLRLPDGSYLYSDLLNYSPKAYATNLLTTSSDAKQKAMCVAMLNYGAAAQNFFSYKPYDLANSGLTAAQKALVKSYSAGMIASVGSVNSSKVGIFTNSGGFSRKYPTVSFESAFCINYYFTPSNTPSGTVKLYYWTQADYNAASTLTPANASGSLFMVNDGTGVYHAVVEGIAAKDLDGTIYVAGGYMSGGTSYCTGVLAYSIGSYCATQAATANAQQALAQATAVYGYYAKQLFYV